MSHPLLYEINTRCWLRELSECYRRTVTLASIPEEEFARWQRLGFTHAWLMGVWTTGPGARDLAQREPELRREYDRVLPGWQIEDVAGSPYAIADYKVPRALGGEAGLKKFRHKLNQRGLKLVLDFVPNHVGMDHPWLRAQSHLFVQSPVEAPGTFPQATSAGTRWLAHGRDPNFPPWTDTAQLDYRRFATHRAMKEVLHSIADRCDGVRCDMAMLVLNDVFARTWERFEVGVQPSGCQRPEQTEGWTPAGVPEFWADVIASVRLAHPGFLFVGEVYWDLESRLQELGFDFTYDKRLYDEIIHRDPAGPQRRLLGVAREFISRSVHFLENHDEPRIAALLSPAEHRAAALLILGLPGMRLLHDGQLAGVSKKTPVQLARRPAESPNAGIVQIYEDLLTTLQASAVGRGTGEVLVPREAGSGNSTAQNVVIIRWQSRPPEFDLVVVNLAAERSQCCAPLSLPGLSAGNWSLKNLLGEEFYERGGVDLERDGLYLDLPPHAAQLLHCEPLA